MGVKGIKEKFQQDAQTVATEIEAFVQAVTALKQEGIGPKAQREFERKSQQVVPNLHLQAGMMGSYLFILQGLDKHGVGIPVPLVDAINKFLNKIDMAFMDFNEDDLSPTVKCDLSVGYNRTRQLYLNRGYRESDLPAKMQPQDFCIEKERMNRKIRKKINSMLAK